MKEEGEEERRRWSALGPCGNDESSKRCNIYETSEAGGGDGSQGAPCFDIEARPRKRSDNLSGGLTVGTRDC